jgi:hypothetical protein
MACLKEERSRKVNRIKKKNDFFLLLLAEMWFRYLQGWIWPFDMLALKFIIKSNVLGLLKFTIQYNTCSSISDPFWMLIRHQSNMDLTSSSDCDMSDSRIWSWDDPSILTNGLRMGSIKVGCFSRNWRILSTSPSFPSGRSVLQKGIGWFSKLFTNTVRMA